MPVARAPRPRARRGGRAALRWPSRDALPPLLPPPPLPRTNRTSLVPPLVLSGHAASLTPYSGRLVD